MNLTDKQQRQEEGYAFPYYYHRKLATGRPEECMGLVAVFKKKSRRP